MTIRFPQRARAAGDHRARAPRVRPRRRRHRDRRAPGARSAAGAAGRASGPGCACPAAGTASSSRCARSSASKSPSRRGASSRARLVRAVRPAGRGRARPRRAPRCRARSPAPRARWSPRICRRSACRAPRRATLIALAAGGARRAAAVRAARRRSRRPSPGCARSPASASGPRTTSRCAPAREPDAFPASDIGLLRGAARNGARPSPAELAARAERWRPWRAYAAQHLWAADAEPARLARKRA